jgi:hypothetical protein
LKYVPFPNSEREYSLTAARIAGRRDLKTGFVIGRSSSAGFRNIGLGPPATAIEKVKFCGALPQGWRHGQRCETVAPDNRREGKNCDDK